MQAGHYSTSGTKEGHGLTTLTRRQVLGLAVVAGAGSLFLAACGSSATATSAPAAVATVAPAPTVAATTAAQSTTVGATGARATTTAAAATGKVNANTASKADITAAFQAAGIPSPDRWAQEVTEYRPYPTDDPTFAKLRSNLAKYNPAPDVVEKIVATLSLS